jgi:tetratricopeptide (TPR) repeat protein
MKLAKLVLPVFLLTALCASVHAQDHHQHDHGAHEELGQVNFRVTCSAAAQKQFNRADALLHSFGYAQAEKAFSEVLTTDPGCVMAYWGIAMSQYHPIWAPPTQAELKKGLAAVEKARSMTVKNARERDYLAAIESFYKDFDKVDHPTRTMAYEKAMEQVFTRYRDDREAAIFYALSLLGTASSRAVDKTFSKQKRAVEILNDVLSKEPNHPGVAHYIIHSYDYPQLASLALPAARSYAKIAPSSPHALHMPTHIFTRLGLWQESIQSNIASANAAKRLVAVTHPGSGSFDQLHAMDYLAYGYLQGCQDRKAKQVLDELKAIDKLDANELAAAYAFAAVPARYAIELSRWSEASKLAIYPASFPWNRFPHAEAITYFARAIGAARSGDPTAARKDVERLEALRQTLVNSKDPYWPTQVEIQKLTAEAWIAKAESRNEDSVKMMRSAAELEDSTDKHPVTPGAILPARELFGDLLLELGRPAEALKEYEASLQTSPNRFKGLYGAGRSAELSGDSKKAGTFYRQLVALSEMADSDRAELGHAKKFLAAKNSGDR